MGNARPWDFDQARASHRAASEAQRAVGDEVKRAWSDAAGKEREYRKSLAVEIVRLHDSGVAWTAAESLARGAEGVADRKHAWDVSEGVKEAATHAAFTASADRKAVEAFTEWSMRRELAEGYGNTVPGSGPMFPAGRAR